MLKEIFLNQMAQQGYPPDKHHRIKYDWYLQKQNILQEKRQKEAQAERD